MGTRVRHETRNNKRAHGNREEGSKDGVEAETAAQNEETEERKEQKKQQKELRFPNNRRLRDTRLTAPELGIRLISPCSTSSSPLIHFP